MIFFLVLRELISVSNYARIRSRRCNYPNQWNTEFKVQMSELPVGKKGIMQHVIYPDSQNFHLLKPTRRCKMWNQSDKVNFFVVKCCSKFQRHRSTPWKTSCFRVFHHPMHSDKVVNSRIYPIVHTFHWNQTMWPLTPIRSNDKSKAANVSFWRHLLDVNLDAFPTARKYFICLGL